MIENERPQPELDFILNLTSERLALQNIPSLSYQFECDHVEEGGAVILTRPSYSIQIFAGSMLIAKVHYELDKRFGMEFKWAEAGTIENLLADRAITGLVMNGVMTMYMIAYNTGKHGNFIIKESEYKAQLGLN